MTARTSTLDFLTLDFDGRGVLERRDGAFASAVPWAMADFGGRDLANGWWRLEIEGDSRGVEMQLSSTHEPLLCINGGAAGGERFRIASHVPHTVRMLLSPWPGETRFTRLAFRRLSSLEVAGLYGHALGRFVSRGNWGPRLWNAARRIMAGQAVGLRVAAPPVQAVHEEPGAPASAGLGESVVRHDDVCVVLREGDRLHPDALAIARCAFARRPEAVALYADAWEGGKLVPAPDWDPVLARYMPFPAPPVFVRAEAAPPGASLREVIAQLAPARGAIGRIALPLVRRAALPPQDIAQVAAPRLARTPSVSIIIPTKIRIDLLDACLRSLAECTDYSDFDVVVVNNGSTDPRLPGVLARWGEALRIEEIVDGAPFNFSRLVNAGVRKSRGEIVVLLNDDIEATEASWLSRLVSSAMEPETGVVGVRLLYPDGTLQHAGVVCGIGGVCGHQWKGMSAAEAARNPYVMLPGERAAVTGACVAIRRKVFDELGGLDEEAFPVAFNDIDFCLRARRAGYRNVYRGDAALIHHESQSRGEDSATLERRLRLRGETEVFLERWGDVLGDDPHASPAFDPMRENGSWRAALDGGW